MLSMAGFLPLGIWVRFGWEPLQTPILMKGIAVTIAVTGATGQLGHLVIDELLKRTSASNIRALAHAEVKAGDITAKGVKVQEMDYDRPYLLELAMEGVDRLLLISSSQVGKRIEQHKNVIEAAKAAGVKLIAYTSILNAEKSPMLLATEHKATEKLLAESGIPTILLRNGWYMENYTGAVKQGAATGTITGVSGDGKLSPAGRADYAAAAAIVLTAETPKPATYELAGDTAFTMAELAAEVSRQTGKAVDYQNLSQEDYKAALIKAGLPEGLVNVLVDSSINSAKGTLFNDSKTLSKLTGQPTLSLKDFVTSLVK